MILTAVLLFYSVSISSSDDCRCTCGDTGRGSSGGSGNCVLRNILVMRLGCRFLDTEVDGSNPNCISMLCP